jgi:hypothetical protein
MHHNKPSSAALIESMEDGDVRDHELLNLMESGQRALLRHKADVKPAWKDKSVCQSVHQQETFLQRKKQTQNLCPSDCISLQHCRHGVGFLVRSNVLLMEISDTDMF